jgi:hypothetical protein
MFSMLKVAGAVGTISVIAGLSMFGVIASANADDDGESALLARKIMSGDYHVEKTPNQYTMIVRVEGTLYKCGMNDRLDRCWQISNLTDPGASNW